MNIPVIYEDEYLMVVDKPAGLLTIPTPKGEKRTLTSILNDDAAEKKAAYRLHPCHRLDRETSGVIVYAKGKAAQKKMMDLFARRGVQKTYLAFVRGTPKPASGNITIPIEGAHAHTRYRTLQVKGGFSILEATLLTGRTNQLRIHCKAIGCPILGERRFAFRRDFTVKAKRLCLHAWRIAFRHPVSAQPLVLEAPLPEDMRALMERQAA